MIKVLLHHGADINAVDRYHCTPLHYQENVDCMIYMLECGANIHAKCNDGNKTPFDIICHQYFNGLLHTQKVSSPRSVDGSPTNGSSRYVGYANFKSGGDIENRQVTRTLSRSTHSERPVSRRAQLTRFILTVHDILEHQSDPILHTAGLTSAPFVPTATSDSTTSSSSSSTGHQTHPSCLLQSIMTQYNWNYFCNHTSGGSTRTFNTYLHDIMLEINRNMFMKFVCGYGLDHHWELFITRDETSDSDCDDDSDGNSAAGLTIVDDSGIKLEVRDTCVEKIHTTTTLPTGNSKSDAINNSDTRVEEHTIKSDISAPIVTLEDTIQMVFRNELLCEKILRYYA